MFDAFDLDLMLRAIELSKNAPAKSSCFRVGAVLTNSQRQILTEGYTLELGEGWHAEEVAIQKALARGLAISGAIVYSSLEPCSTRKSRAKDCSALLIENGVGKVFYAMAEPPIFVQCQGVKKLEAAGIKVEKIAEMEDAAKAVNQHLFDCCG